MTWSRATATAGSAAVTVACYRLRIVRGHCEPWRVGSDLPVFAGQSGPPKKAHFCDRHHIANATLALASNLTEGRNAMARFLRATSRLVRRDNMRCSGMEFCAFGL